MNNILNEVYSRVAGINEKKKIIILYMVCAASMFFIRGDRFSNIINYQIIIAISALCGLLIYISLYCISKDVVSVSSQKSGLSCFRDIVVISIACILTLSAPFYLLITVLNSYFDTSPVRIQAVEVLERKLRPLGRNHQVPELCVDLQVSKNDVPTAYNIDVTWDLYNASNPGDKIQVGMRSGALGFAYVSSIAKAEP